MRNEEVLQRVEEERTILHTTKRIEANPIGYTLRRNCLLKHVTEGKRRKDRSYGKTRKRA